MRMGPMGVWVCFLAGLAAALGAARAFPQVPTHGYATRLILDAPIAASPDRTITGTGAPGGLGTYVELWRVPPGSARAEPVASVAAEGGAFAFPSVEVQAGESYYATLSRGWLFNTDGDTEGWGTCADCSGDAAVTVEGGVLKIRVEDADGDGSLFPFLQINADFDPTFYRVVEIRLKNPTGWVVLGLYWGNAASPGFFGHLPIYPPDSNLLQPNLPAQMEGFQTILFPMNAGEVDFRPDPPAIADGLWDAGVLNDRLVIVPLEFLPAGDLSLAGAVFEIDAIRLREDYRLDFHDDPQGIDFTNDCAAVAVEGGFLSYEVQDLGSPANPQPNGVSNPFLFSTLFTGYFETAYFTTMGVGYDRLEIKEPLVDPNGTGYTGIGFFFQDLDSDVFLDDHGGPGSILQFAGALAPVAGRFDGFAPIDEICFDPLTGADAFGEWSEDGRPFAQALRLEFPDIATAGDQAALDYFAIIPAEPFGPSDPVLAAAAPEPRFRRGDADGIGDADITDAIFILGALFLGSEQPSCPDAADVDDSGTVDITDAINLLIYLFLGGAAPADPGPARCDPDPTGGDALAECLYPAAQCP